MNYVPAQNREHGIELWHGMVVVFGNMEGENKKQSGGAWMQHLPSGWFLLRLRPPLEPPPLPYLTTAAAP